MVSKLLSVYRNFVPNNRKPSSTGLTIEEIYWVIHEMSRGRASSKFNPEDQFLTVHSAFFAIAFLIKLALLAFPGW